jgi:hypothetical protein
MTFRYTDPRGGRLEVRATQLRDGTPAIALYALDCHESTDIPIPLDRIEELIAGIRDTARQAAREQT